MGLVEVRGELGLYAALASLRREGRPHCQLLQVALELAMLHVVWSGVASFPPG